MTQWEYNDARNSICGTMICGKCSKPITDGRYRTRQKSRGDDWFFSSQHEACSKDDPKWAKTDAQAAKDQAAQERFVAACVEFKSKWGRHLSGELDEYIPEETSA